MMKQTASIQHNVVRGGERVVSLAWPPQSVVNLPNMIVIVFAF